MLIRKKETCGITQDLRLLRWGGGGAHERTKNGEEWR